MIAVERHGEMRQGMKSGSEFKFKKRQWKTGFCFFAASFYEFSFFSQSDKSKTLNFTISLS